jgi:hypothetical protein
MIKFLIITFLILYLLFKVGGFLLRMLFYTIGNRAQQRFSGNGQQYTRTKPKDANVDVEYRQSTKKPEFKGGEYIDYEEVK